jgi:tetratricopeptide (TPR) repeat protein
MGKKLGMIGAGVLGLGMAGLGLLVGADQAFGATDRYGYTSVDRLRGIYVVQSHGNDYEVSYESSRVLARELADGMIPYMGNYIANMLRNAIGKSIPGFLIDFLTSILFYWPIFDNIVEREGMMLRGIWNGAKDGGYLLDYNLVRRAYVAPEVNHLVIEKAVALGVLPGIMDTRLYGCASSIVLPETSGSDKTYFLRGMDYSGLNKFDKYPTIHLIKPDEGARYVVVNSAGLSSIPLTAINQYGLAFVLHVTVTADVNASGTMVFHALEQVIRQAQTIEQAYDILRHTRHISGWQVHITDTHEGQRRAAVIELSGKQTHLVMRSSYSNVANSYFSASQKAREISLGQTVLNHNLYRLNRLNQLMQQYQGQFSVDTAVRILRDNMDGFSGKWTSYSPNIIATVDQVKAIVMELSGDPTDVTLWVANGLAPASQGEFVPFDLSAFLSNGYAPLPGTQIIPAQPRTQSGNGYVGFAGYADFKTAFMAMENEQNPRKALKYIWSAAMKDRNHYYRLASGILFLRELEFMDALQQFFQIIHSSMLDTHHKNIARMYAALTFDALGDRDEAVERYREILARRDVDSFIKDAARVRLRYKFTREQAQTVKPDMKWMDVFGYNK